MYVIKIGSMYLTTENGKLVLTDRQGEALRLDHNPSDYGTPRLVRLRPRASTVPSTETPWHTGEDHSPFNPF